MVLEHMLFNRVIDTTEFTSQFEWNGS